MTPTTLTAKQRQVIEALVAGKTITATAETCGISRMSVHRYLNDPTFMTELRTAENALIDHGTRRLIALIDLAADTLAAAMSGRAQVTGAAIRAADIALTKMLLLRENHDLALRVAALEERTNGRTT